MALRAPSHRVARALMEMAGVPIAAPSANRFSRPSPTTAAHVKDDLDGRVDLILDGGVTDIGLESTIVDFSVDPPVLRRPGGITFEQVHSLVPDVTLESGEGDAADPQVAPGQLTRHYAPKAALTLYEGDPALVIEKIGADARTAVAQGSRVGILAPEDDLKALAPVLASGGVKRPDRGASLRLPGGYREGGTGILRRPEGPGRYGRLGDSRQLGRERRAGAGHPRPARARGRRAY